MKGLSRDIVVKLPLVWSDNGTGDQAATPLQ